MSRWQVWNPKSDFSDWDLNHLHGAPSVLDLSQRCAVWASLEAQTVKNSPAMQVLDHWVGKIPLRREMLPTPVFLPRESQGQRSLAGYSPWGRKESDVTEQLAIFISHPCYLWDISPVKGHLSERETLGSTAWCEKMETEDQRKLHGPGVVTSYPQNWSASGQFCWTRACGLKESMASSVPLRDWDFFLFFVLWHLFKALLYFWRCVLFQGLHWWSSGLDSALPMQGVWVWSLLRELDFTCCN